MIQFNEHILAVLDVETTGRDCAYHDIVQVAILPLEPTNLDPHPDFGMFYQNLQPLHPERVEPIAMQVNGLDLEELKLSPHPEEVAEVLLNWYRAMNLPLGKRLLPLCQNSSFDISFMQQWLGIELFGEIFSRRGRDTMYLASGIQDKFSWAGLPLPFNELGLKPLCDHFGINIEGHHDALADCLATAKLYRELLRMDIP